MFTDTLVLPLDRARTQLFAGALKIGVLRGLLLEKSRRIPLLLGVHALAALVLAVLAPTLLLLAGPLLLGVPHLVSDVRYLILRPAIGARLRTVLLAGSALLLLLRVAHGLGLARLSSAELLVAGGLILTASLCAAQKRASWRVGLVLVALLALGSAAWVWPRAFGVVLAHAHNLVALALWVFGFARQRRSATLLALGFLGVGALLLATPLAWFGFELGLRECLGLSSFQAAAALAPGVRSTTLALGLVSSFAFLQSLHYAIWLHAVPQEETRGNATLSFRMSARQLRRELGRWGFFAAAALTLAVPALACCGSVVGTKDLYLSLSAFHAYLELAAGAVFFVSGARPRASAENACC